MSEASMERAGAGRGSLKSYLTGFVISLILTAIPFAMVMSGAFSSSVILICIFIAAVTQIAAHLHYFLHVDSSSSAGWNTLALIFTVVIMTLFVGGTIWIMWSLHYRMM